MVAISPDDAPDALQSKSAKFKEFARRNPTIVIGVSILSFMVILALLAPYLTPDPRALNPIDRLKPPGEEFWFGTDQLGRSIFDRTIHGTRISLGIGLTVAVISTIIGLSIGLVTGYVRWLDAILMRVMDGVMAIPGLLFAIALMALLGASVTNVIIAITIPEIPRTVRLVRAVVLTLREQPYVEAAVSVGTKLPAILIRHILPNTVAPLIVQATYVCASAMIVEAFLSFVGAGTPPEVPSWGNMMAEGRIYFQIYPWMLLFPGIALSVVVLTVNILGDGLRDTLDPRIARRMK